MPRPNKLPNLRIGVTQVAKNPGISRTTLDARRIQARIHPLDTAHAFGRNPFLKILVTVFFKNSRFSLPIRGQRTLGKIMPVVIRTSYCACPATNAFVIIHQHNPAILINIGSSGRANRLTGGFITVITNLRGENPGYIRIGSYFLQQGLSPKNSPGHTIFLFAGHSTGLAANTSF